MNLELFPRDQIHIEAHDTNSRGTPTWLIKAICSVWKFQLDACASSWNAKHENYYSLEKGQNSLELPWYQKTCNSRVWCNPPYDNILPWVEKALSEKDENDFLVEVCMLLPARTEMDWFQKLWELHTKHLGGSSWDTLKKMMLHGSNNFDPVVIHFLPFRVQFDYPPGHSGGSSNPERSILVTSGIRREDSHKIFDVLCKAKR